MHLKAREGTYKLIQLAPCDAEMGTTLQTIPRSQWRLFLKGTQPLYLGCRLENKGI